MLKVLSLADIDKFRRGDNRRRFKASAVFILEMRHVAAAAQIASVFSARALLATSAARG